MFGTVARMRAKPGSEAKLMELMKEYEALDVPGFVATYVYRLDGDGNDYYMVALFKDRESYFANAQSPDQDRRYRRMRKLFEADPKWHDGEVIYSQTQAG
jgi:antibiotic biosynthesis monooxygenase (ABM) superfamily enzyme